MVQGINAAQRCSLFGVGSMIQCGWQKFCDLAKAIGSLVERFFRCICPCLFSKNAQSVLPSATSAAPVAAHSVAQPPAAQATAAPAVVVQPAASQSARGNERGSEEITLDALTKHAEKEEDAFLIDFSKIKPSNIFEIFDEGGRCSWDYGDVALYVYDPSNYDESHKFKHGFQFKYSINIVTGEAEKGQTITNGYMFTMNDQGKVESYGDIFDNFNSYIEHRMSSTVYVKEGHVCEYAFQHLDFYSIRTDTGYKKLRKKPIANSF